MPRHVNSLRYDNSSSDDEDSSVDDLPVLLAIHDAMSEQEVPRAPVKLAEVPGFSVRIVPTATFVFDSSKLKPKCNNVRSLREEAIFQATPRYNSSILEDMFMVENVEFVNRTFREWKSLRDALILLKAWLVREVPCTCTMV
ncbi:hypothetical protein CDL15_Pgr005166 [Punica granatum]|uniref:Nrap protein domain-containing protein n=1 Tax=Punica granatum TaxID=22663 RepID=A0A218WPM3_PUNGR|nr:hypothetical protein CDL15_Pgr005166 [Punica granatum]